MYKNKKDIFKRIAFAGAMAASFMVPFGWSVPEASADSYVSDTKTDANVLDFIENRRRDERENAKTAEQLQLLKDAHAMKEGLREPLDPTKNVPIAVEGDDMYYNQVNGDVRATGNVIVTSLDARRFITDEALGNMKATTVQVDGKAHMLQLTPGQLSIVLTGYRTQYNFTDKTGKMEDASGKAGEQYIKADRIEFYPDKIVLYHAYETKCSAKHPDYRYQAEKIERFPDKKCTVYYKLRVFVGDIPVYSTPKRTFYDQQGNRPHLPKAGYDSDDGFWIQDRYDLQLADRVSAYVDLKYQTKNNFHGNFGVKWDTKGAGSFQLRNGWFEDSNDNWIRKSPVFNYSYGNHLKTLPFMWSVGYERGSWNQNNVHSMHTEYNFTITPDTLILAKNWFLNSFITYGITQESVNDTTNDGFKYGVTLLHEFDKRWAWYTSYHYDYSTVQNSPFNYDLADYGRRWSTGLSYRFDDKNRIVAGWAWDMTAHTLANADYYYFRDMHCAELIVRYRGDTGSWAFKVQFTPW